ncbi:MAG: hypothetical protein RIR41_2042 [Pseudomonadota bacterium]
MPITRISCKCYGFPASVIHYAMWLRFCLTLSLRDAEEIMAHRGVDVSDEPMRALTVKFGRKIAASLRHRKLPQSPRWRLGEMICGSARERVFLWRAVDDEGEGLDIFVQKRGNTRAALKLLLRSQPVGSESIGALVLASCSPALRAIGNKKSIGLVFCARKRG